MFSVTGNDGRSDYAQFAYSICTQRNVLFPDDLKELYSSGINTYDSTDGFTIRYTFRENGTYILIVSL